MSAIIPQEGIIDTGRMIRAFTKENMDYFWRYLKPLLPWIIGLHAIDATVTMAFPDMGGKFALGSLIASYFYACFAITWHRVVLHGPEHTEPMNPFKPERSDWAFIGMAVGLFIASVLVGILAGSLLFLGPIGAIFFIAAVFALIVCFAKFSFYFPAKAVKSHMSLKDSFHATNGYIIKLWTAPFVASWRLLLCTFLYFFIAAAIAGIVVSMTQYSPDEPPSTLAITFGFLIQIPMMVYFQPAMYALGIGVLSNYYQHAMQNKSV